MAKVNSLSIGASPVADFIVERGTSGNDWYVVYNSGWKEQGGIRTGQNVTHTITFPKPFSNTNYTMSISGIANTSVSSDCAVGAINEGRSNTSIKIQTVTLGYGYYWEAKGF